MYRASSRLRSIERKVAMKGSRMYIVQVARESDQEQAYRELLSNIDMHPADRVVYVVSNFDDGDHWTPTERNNSNV